MEDFIIGTDFNEDINEAVKLTLKQHRPVQTKAFDNTDMLVMRTEDFQKMWEEYELYLKLLEAQESVKAGKFHTLEEVHKRCNAILKEKFGER